AGIRRIFLEKIDISHVINPFCIVIAKKERVDERLIEKIDISFALTIDVPVILSRQRWMIGNSNVYLVFCWLTMLRNRVGCEMRW
ncbi:hypothetical protein Tco_0166335, partial [Tanacetum coccineum]